MAFEPESSFPNTFPVLFAPGMLSTMTANSCVLPPIRMGMPPPRTAMLARKLRKVGAIKELFLPTTKNNENAPSCSFVCRRLTDLADHRHFN